VATTTYDDLAAAKPTLQLHARAQCYSIAVECKDEKRGRAAFVCSKSEKYRATGKDPDMHKSKQRPNTGTMKTECPFKIIFKRDDSTGGWYVVSQKNDHNHDAVSSISALLAHRIVQ
jgi:hypothetical protein